MYSTYTNYGAPKSSQTQPQAQPIATSQYASQQVALVPAGGGLTRLQISPLLPQAVFNTLERKPQILNSFASVVAKNKSALERDLDNFLKEIILMFEELKQQLFAKMDDHSASFQKVYDQYEKIACDCSDWAEQKIGSSNFQYDMKSSVHDLLSQGLNQARFQKQKADDIEKSLLAIKQKIDSSKLMELSDEIAMLSDERNQTMYVPEEARQFFDQLKAALKLKIGQLNQSKVVPPFAFGPQTQPVPEKGPVYFDQEIRQSGPVVGGTNVNVAGAAVGQPKVNLSGFLQQMVGTNTNVNAGPIAGALSVRSEVPVQAPSTGRLSNMSAREGLGLSVRQGYDPKVGIIAQQNQFYSDDILLTNPTIKQEKELQFKIKARINCVLSLISNIALFGSEDGSIVIVNITTNGQSVVKAHTAPVQGLTKANESLVISSASKPDLAIKLWDFGPILSAAASSDPSRPPGNVLLVGVLNGLTDAAIGHGFIAENLILAVGKDGQIIVWDWKTGVAITQGKADVNMVSGFTLFSDRDSFAICTPEGYVQAYSILRDGRNFTFQKQSEFKEAFPILGLQSFRGNSDVIIIALSSGDVKLLNKRTKVNYHTIIGCKNPIAFFILNSVRSDSTIYLMSIEPYGFKLADIDGRDFAFVNTASTANFKFERIGWPNWQIIDSVPKEKVNFITVNNGREPNDAIIWSLNANK